MVGSSSRHIARGPQPEPRTKEEESELLKSPDFTAKSRDLCPDKVRSCSASVLEKLVLAVYTRTGIPSCRASCASQPPYNPHANPTPPLGSPDISPNASPVRLSIIAVRNPCWETINGSSPEIGLMATGITPAQNNAKFGSPENSRNVLHLRQGLLPGRSCSIYDQTEALPGLIGTSGAYME
jgi:hypothetical protein